MSPLCGTRSLKGELCVLEAEHVGGHSFRALEEVRLDAELAREEPFVPSSGTGMATAMLIAAAAAQPGHFVDPLFWVPRTESTRERALRAKRNKKNKQAKLSRKRNRGR